MESPTQLPRTRTLMRGIDGSGRPVWIVQTCTTLPCGRKRYHSDRFHRESEARAWMRWA